MSVSEILESIRLASTSERDKGDRFETLMRTALRTDRTYAEQFTDVWLCLLYTSPSPRDQRGSRMPSSA